MPEYTTQQLSDKIDAIEEVYSRVVITLIEMTATLNVLLEYVLDDASEEEQEEFAQKVNDIQMESAQFLKEELDNVRGQAQD